MSENGRAFEGPKRERENRMTLGEYYHMAGEVKLRFERGENAKEEEKNESMDKNSKIPFLKVTDIGARIKEFEKVKNTLTF